jgi:hypothetical protein
MYEPYKDYWKYREIDQDIGDVMRELGKYLPQKKEFHMVYETATKLIELGVSNRIN